MDKDHWLRNDYIAHRGLHDDKKHIENSLSSFEEAIKYGYGIELDVRLTKDNQVVVFHDHHLQRICGENKTIEQTLLKQLASYHLKNTKEMIPTLNKVLNLVSGKVPLLIELKTHKNAKKLSKAVHNLLENYDGDYAIQSYNPSVLRWYRKHSPHVLRGQIAQKNKRNEKNIFIRLFTNYFLLNIFPTPNFINYRLQDLPLKKLDMLYKKGCPIISFTAKSQEQLDFVKRHYDNAVFEGFQPKKEPT